MRILVVSNLYPPVVQGGFELACRQAVEGLRARGHEVVVLTSQAAAPAADGVLRRFRLAPVFSTPEMALHTPAVRQLLELGSIGLEASNVAALVEAVEAVQPDVAYVWNLAGLGGLGLLVALQELGVPWVGHLADAVPRWLCSSRGQVVPELAAWWQTATTGTWITCSARLRREIEEGGGPSLGDAVQLPLWVTGPPSPPAPWDGGALRVAFAGQVAPHKGVDVLVRAVAALDRPGALAVTCYGEIVDRSITVLARELGVDGDVRFAGPVGQDELAAALATHHVFAFPTWEREPFGIAPIEAAHHGCLPVLTGGAGVAEHLVDGVHCLKVERSPGAVAAAMARILDGAVDLAALRRRAAAVVADTLHVDIVLPRVEAVLAGAAARGRHPRRPPAQVVALAAVVEHALRAVVEQTSG